MAIERPKLLFGLGAAKAGTSWLYRYLSDHGDCAMPGIKELHYFDTLQHGALAKARRRLDLQIAARRDIAIHARLGKDPTWDREIDAMIRWRAVLRDRTYDVQRYLDFLHSASEGSCLVGDITPAYALLSSEMLLRMQSLQPNVRFVYILRDPVDRLWSHLRMLALRKVGRAGDIPKTALSLFDAWAAGLHPEVDSRGDYRSTILKLESALDMRRVHICFFEEMISAPGIASLCAFLQIRFMPPDTNRRVHAGIGVPLDPDRAAFALDHMSEQYRFVKNWFGRLPVQWQPKHTGEW